MQQKLFDQIKKELWYFFVALPIYFVIELMNLERFGYATIIFINAACFLLLFAFIMITTKESLTLSVIKRFIIKTRGKV
jgi:hypothetical protein